MAAATSAGVMRAHFGARYTWPRRCCAGCRTAAADHLLLETMGCAAVGRSFVMSSNSTEAWDAQEWAVIELQHRPCRLFHPYPVKFGGLLMSSYPLWSVCSLLLSVSCQSVLPVDSLSTMVLHLHIQKCRKWAHVRQDIPTSRPPGGRNLLNALRRRPFSI